MDPMRAKCPICERPTRLGQDYFPFCSERCQTLDLANWSTEAYRIPGKPLRQGLAELEDQDDEAQQ
ncbi:MAG: DNA gyrase inhibitor YacG [Bryobacter sp.]|nr:DNA gyrase inhibitor YacG [Bryobacter sp.]